MIKPKVVLLIFVSGKIVLTGAKVKFYSLSYETLRRETCEMRRDTRVLTNRRRRPSGPRGDLHRVQYDLHGALRIPQAVNAYRNASVVSDLCCSALSVRPPSICCRRLCPLLKGAAALVGGGGGQWRDGRKDMDTSRGSMRMTLLHSLRAQPTIQPAYLHTYIPPCPKTFVAICTYTSMPVTVFCTLYMPFAFAAHLFF